MLKKYKRGEKKIKARRTKNKLVVCIEKIVIPNL